MDTGSKRTAKTDSKFSKKRDKIDFFFLTIKPIRYHSAGHTIGSQ